MTGLAKLSPHLQMRVAALTFEDNDLPAGVCGRVRGIALPFEVLDSYRTVFRRGCTDKTRNKAAKRKIKLFDNHGMVDWYGTRTHIGVVTGLEYDASLNADVMTADIFDTEDGRRCKEYLRAVVSSGGETGLSVGFYVRESCTETWQGERVDVFTEIEIDEISLAPRNAVPGAVVTGVRADLPELQIRAMLQHLAKRLTRAQWIELTLNIVTADEADDAAKGDEPDAEGSRAAGDEPEAVTMDDRLMAYRRLVATT